VIEYLGMDEKTSVIAAYVEQIRDGQHFIRTAREVTRRKPIVLLKAGRTSAGARAVSSHTGSLAGSHSAYQAAFQQSGVVEVETMSELFEVSQALALQHLPKGTRVAILTNSGGPAALTSDSLAVNGYSMADLTDATKNALRGILNPSAQVANPVDMLGGAEPHEYEEAMRLVAADVNVDIIVPILVPQSLVNPVEVAQKIVDVAADTQKTVISCFVGDSLVAEPRRLLHAGKVPMVVYPESVGKILGAMLSYAGWLAHPVEQPVNFQEVDPNVVKQILSAADPKDGLGEAQTRPILAAYGIPVVTGDRAVNAEEAAAVAERIGFPVVMKIVSPDILHKSDFGGIRLNLKTKADVLTAYADMMKEVGVKKPGARLEGVLIEAMAPKGQEVIVGMRRDPGFGAMMMFGMGGIYVELFKDVAFRVAPLTRSDAYEMIRSTHAGKLLAGFRGSQPADIDAVVDMILRLSQLAVDFTEISEVEINPLLVFPQGQGAVALDCRGILGQAG
ncbi:MAG: acetate--CoA ligase family protein, partial [Anaerolineaceae bacterium]|nr:acetate--CoA ligase family protein [Anaerolineaceae bacterium]